MIRIELKIGDFYFGVRPMEERLKLKSRIMTRLNIKNLAFHKRISGKVNITLDEAVVWKQELNLETVESLYTVLPTPSAQEAKEQVSTG
jgi:hypothetical protein